MTTQDEKRAMLRHVPVFASLSDADCDALLACLRFRTLEPGKVLFREGEPGDTMVVVGRGGLQISMALAAGSSETIRTVSAGAMLGEMACVDPAPRSATATAMGSTLVFELSRDGLDALKRMAPTLASVVVGAVIRDVTARLRDIETRIDRELAEHGDVVHVGHVPAAGTAPPPRKATGLWRVLEHLKGSD